MVNFKKSQVIITSLKGYNNPKKIHADLCDYFNVPKGTDIILRVDDAMDEIEELLNPETLEGYSHETEKVAKALVKLLASEKDKAEYIWLDY